MPHIRVPPDVRFNAKVVKSNDPDGCWVFTGAKVGPKGHRKFCPQHGVFVLAHRYSWTRTFGDPGTLCVLHKCDNPPCVRPDHLFLGTRAENNADMDRKGRRKPHTGEKHPLAKLTVIKVREIRERYEKGGASYPKLAKEYGVGQSTIQNIIEGKTWKTA